jgi:hypothetical protein
MSEDVSHLPDPPPRRFLDRFGAFSKSVTMARESLTSKMRGLTELYSMTDTDAGSMMIR